MEAYTMDFSDTPDEAAFRAEVIKFLDENATRKAGREHDTEAVDATHVAKAKEWQAKKASAGFAGITWPKAWGGRGGTPMQQVIYGQEEAKYNLPRGVFEIGLGMCIPTVASYATPETAQHHVGPALRGETIWCQLFSEPAAGSDVAGLRTRAERDGDDWIINGQKIWTSGAHFADFGLLLTRTDATVVKHAGLSMFFLDMKSPGVEVRRIKQISGTSNFNEVFFTDVRIPDSQRLGKVGEGWKVALTTLMHERLAVGMLGGPDFGDLLELARTIEVNGAAAIKNAAVRERIADWYVQSKGLEYTKFRTITALSRGQMPGPESSIYKVVSATKLQEIAHFALDLMDSAGMISDPATAPMRAIFQQSLLYSPGGRIAGGTDEILRNIIAERVLGMPGDVRVDRDKPFNQLGA
jgi:alkylation response protein AidB-like acyl-CoA dehydrogenase